MSLEDDLAEDVTAAGSDRHQDGELAPALAHGVGQEAVDPDHGEKEGEGSEKPEERGRRPLEPQGFLDEVAHGVDVGQGKARNLLAQGSE